MTTGDSHCYSILTRRKNQEGSAAGITGPNLDTYFAAGGSNTASIT
jgi:hypothetical protein